MTDDNKLKRALELVAKTDDSADLRQIRANAVAKGKTEVVDAIDGKLSLLAEDSQTCRVTKRRDDGAPAEIAVTGQLGQWWVKTPHLGEVPVLHDAFVSGDRKTYSEPACRYEPKPREARRHLERINAAGYVMLTTDEIDGVRTKRTGYVSVVRAANARIEGGQFKADLGEVNCTVIPMREAR